eukprot:TRINITY_DN80143_c0_g1_i1.p1 TRINITY_DN80143_c0_g1~~TRINITY_DN80143_c0_g1_i1.p1  ORF type:complete len:457 (-),score=138.82 TRINITY_DN80143_c0_g1_i1:144-1514(-)
MAFFATPRASRRSVGGHEQTSLREALRARGGAQKAVDTSAPTDIEDNDRSKREKGSLDWLDLKAFAPKAIQGVVDKIRAGAEAEDGMIQSVAQSLKRVGDEITGNFPEDTSSSKKNEKKNDKKASGGLRSALQARGGINRPSASQGAAATAAPTEGSSASSNAEVSAKAANAEPLVSVQEAAEHQKDDLAAEEREDQGAPEDSPLPSVTEEDADEIEAENNDSQLEAVGSSHADKEPQLEVAVEEKEEMAEENVEVQQDGDSDGSAIGEPPQDSSKEAESKEAQSSVDEKKASISEALPISSPKASPEENESSKGAVKVVEGSSDAPKRKKSSEAGYPKAMPFVPKAPAADLESHTVIVETSQEEVQKEPGPAKPALLAPAAPSRRPDRSSNTDDGKLRELKEFWGAKSNKGFAGPSLNGSRLSKNEAQATLQRLVAAGGDFDEVRRLRKLIAELD